MDGHIWLDPDNARTMVTSLASTLTRHAPAHAARIAANAAALQERIAALEADLGRELEPVRGRPFIVFHDAYQYLEHRYGLDAAGAITLSPDTGLPAAVPALEVDDGVTLALARPWAATLQTTGHFEHRSSDEAHELYGQLGLPVKAWGENIAWFTGFDIEQAARIHFEGWRESDAGHYCALVSPRFTHVGVGAIEDGGQSWAVQNFYG